MSTRKKVSIDHPVGYLSTTLPFWEHLDDSEFEEFCTQWLNLHPKISYVTQGKAVTLTSVEAARLASGTSQRGVDVRAQMDNGENWFLQCKLEKEFGPADVRAAVELAERERPNADRLVLVTACGLSDAAQEIINVRQNWTWWDSTRLTTEIQKVEPTEDGMELVHRFFGAEWVKRIFPWGVKILHRWSDYFAADIDPKRILFHHRSNFLLYGDALDRLKNFAEHGCGRALVLSAAGGQGKSRLLLELARTLEAESKELRVRFLNIGGRPLTDEAAELISRQRNLLLIIEDAHRLEGLVSQVAHATSKSDSVRLLVATRPQAREAIQSELSANGYTERLDPPVNLPRWTETAIHKLAEQVLTPVNHIHSPRLTKLADRCPLLVVIGAGLLNSGRSPELMNDETLFRERVYKGFLEDFLAGFEGEERRRLRFLIRTLAFIGPVKKDDSLLERLSPVLQCSTVTLSDDIDTLRTAGLVAENREGIRVYPDLFADAVLLDAALDQNGKPSHLCTTVIESLSDSDFPALLRNLAQADWEYREKRSLQSRVFDLVWNEYVQRFSNASGTERSQMLSHWAGFAVFQPDRTVELARLSLDLGGSDGVLWRLPSILKPIVMWHPQHASKALDVLWSLPAEETKGSYADEHDPIGAISSAATFEIYRHFGSENVLAWFEKMYQSVPTKNRLGEQPWIINKIFEPYFARTIEHTWATGRTYNIKTLRLSAERTRPLRNRALALIRYFALLENPIFSHASILVLEKATERNHSKFRYESTEAERELWRSDRLTALGVVREVIDVHGQSHVTMLIIRDLLLHLVHYDQDPIIRGEAECLLETIPDTLPLRTARALTSSPDKEFKCDSRRESEKAQRDWTKFCEEVAQDVASRFPKSKELCAYLEVQVETLRRSRFNLQRYTVVNNVAGLSKQWCEEMLTELVRRPSAHLDSFLREVLARAVTVSESYEKSVEFLSVNGRDTQVSSLTSFLGWKHLHGGGLTVFERGALLSCARRPEPMIVTDIALIAGLHLDNEPAFATELLQNLTPLDEASGSAVLKALSSLVKKNPGKINRSAVCRCLESLGDNAFSTKLHEDRYWEDIAREFPTEVYLHFRDRLDAERNIHFAVLELPKLGSISDLDWVDAEILWQWQTCSTNEKLRYSRFALIRALLASDPNRVEEQMKKIIETCSNGEQLTTAVSLFAEPGSRFVYQQVEIVRILLVQGQILGIQQAILRELISSACNGGRGYSENELDPEYRYIREEAERLLAANRQDLYLAPLYESIIQREKYELELNRRLFADDEDGGQD